MPIMAMAALHLKTFLRFMFFCISVLQTYIKTEFYLSSKSYFFGKTLFFYTNNMLYLQNIRSNAFLCACASFVKDKINDYDKRFVKE